MRASWIVRTGLLAVAALQVGCCTVAVWLPEPAERGPAPMIGVRQATRTSTGEVHLEMVSTDCTRSHLVAHAGEPVARLDPTPFPTQSARPQVLDGDRLFDARGARIFGPDGPLDAWVVLSSGGLAVRDATGQRHLADLPPPPPRPLWPRVAGVLGNVALTPLAVAADAVIVAGLSPYLVPLMLFCPGFATDLPGIVVKLARKVRDEPAVAP